MGSGCGDAHCGAGYGDDCVSADAGAVCDC